MSGRGLICVSVMAEDGRAVLAAVSPVLPLVDVVEIRLDGISDPRNAAIADCIGALATLEKTVLVTNRPVWEGGQWAVGEEERINLLCQALDWGARYVDVELRAAPELRAQVVASARQHQAETIISHHDFERTRTSKHLACLLEQMMDSGAAIGKIVTTAQTPDDALRVLALQEQAKAACFPLIAFAMGHAGTISRLATLYLGGAMSYVALSKEQATAPGQLSIHALQHLISTLEGQP